MRGGITVEPVLGSRSYDVLSGIGPQPLQPGDVLPVGEHTANFPELDQAPVASFAEDPIELNVVPGPRDDWFTDPDALGTAIGWPPIEATELACGWSGDRCSTGGRIASCP